MIGAEEKEASHESSSCHTEYVLEVKAEGGHKWTVRRRFSDFLRLQKALLPFAGTRGLPLCWEAVGKSRTATGSQRCVVKHFFCSEL